MEAIPQIPPELHDRIIDHLHDDFSALAACGLASRIWLSSVRYHRFGSTQITVPRFEEFSDLLENSPEIGAYVYDLSLGTRRTPVHRVLPDHMITTLVRRLPYVEHLRLVSFIWKPRYQVLYEAYPGLRTLRIEHCRFDSETENSDGFVDFVSSFHRLTTLSLHRPVQVTHAGGCGWIWNKSLQHPPLRNLELTSVPGAETLCDWLRHGPSLPNISTFFTSVSEDWEGAIALHAFKSFGETIENLTLVLDSYSGLESLFEDSAFTISYCTNLRSLNLELRIHGMCIRTDPTLRRITSILSQITSPHIEKIMLSVYADPMSDFSGLDTECAVRPLRLASFTDLMELNWDGIYCAVARELSSGLPALSVRATGRSEPLRKHLANYNSGVGFEQIKDE
ncbi:hypothetical protein EIP91_012399 [Steccherinum ochraceum]|uniref:F-box domain-containing protein n=1 Tax=Steccherinum ochraceum TaxID=92696 RepID=A0A4V2MWT1_9APHY|nr:hypothetical protein EIP91_012399 [Steccherinum ochraceum]